MSVEFNEPPVVVRSRAERVSFLSALVIKTGLARSAQGAQLVLLIIAALCVLTAAFSFAGSSKQPPQPTPAQVAL